MIFAIITLLVSSAVSVYCAPRKGYADAYYITRKDAPGVLIGLNAIRFAAGVVASLAALILLYLMF